ncbi:hypothetical protein AX14_005087 [Amanita brunnescens Koide BX004]|nr:hypothetical protein AX14_005087 [Amanita brunnescens Koide BX004]
MMSKPTIPPNPPTTINPQALQNPDAIYEAFSDIRTDCPILIWMLSLNREYTRQEYEDCWQLVHDCIPHITIEKQPENADSFRQIMTEMLPLLMMRHRRIPRAKWRDRLNSSGKHWIEQIPETMQYEKWVHSMIGYHLDIQGSLCGMAMTQGTRNRVLNIGLAIKQLAVEPRGVSVSAYAESQAHKLTELEKEAVFNKADEVALRRLAIILALKQAYIKAIGQPLGFDWSRLEFNIEERTATGDGNMLIGWEFRIFKANLGVIRRNRLYEEQYQCVCAFYRGHRHVRYIWQETSKELAEWVQFINIDQMLKVLPKLSA